MLAQGNACGYTFLWDTYAMFHLALTTNSISLTLKHPEQGCKSFQDYFQDIEFTYDMQGIISDHYFEHDNHNVQDICISNLHSSQRVLEIVHF